MLGRAVPERWSHSFYRAASTTLSSQPRSIAVSSDSTVFIAEINSIEAFRSNQKIHTLQPKYSPHAVAASGILVATGGDVRPPLYTGTQPG